jgi:hypothetical protein
MSWSRLLLLPLQHRINALQQRLEADEVDAIAIQGGGHQLPGQKLEVFTPNKLMKTGENHWKHPQKPGSCVERYGKIPMNIEI